jgi:predicted DNA-binding transcriptional regulator YafY
VGVIHSDLTEGLAASAGWAWRFVGGRTDNSRVNRTDRLYALVEELRAVSPRVRSATWLARRFEVSARTIERDLDALRQSGVPLWSQPGRSGGYALDRDRTLPPLALTAGEALAIGVALRAAAGSPFATQARSASLKILATLPADVRRREEALAARVHQVGDQAPVSGLASVVASAIEQQRVLRLVYEDRAGIRTERDVEPLGLLWGPHGWYLLAWCRLRHGVRGFLLDRMRGALTLTESVPERDDGALRRELSSWDTRSLRDMPQ